MRMSVGFVLLLAVHGAVAAAGADAGVVTLTDQNFDELTSTGSWLLSFYAPWCQHCTTLDPVFAQAASKSPKLRFGKIDCTVESQLVKRFDVRGYPTLQFFRDGQASPYKGGRTESDFIDFASAVTSPPVQPVPDNPNAKFDTSFLYSGPPTGPAFDHFVKAARQLQGSFGFYQSKIAKTGTPIVERISEMAAKLSFSLNDFDKFPNAFVDWIRANRLPLISELGVDNFMDLTSGHQRLMIMIVQPSTQSPDDIGRLKNVLRQAAAVQASKPNSLFLFAWIDGDRWASWLKLINTSNAAAFVYDHINERHWPATASTVANPALINLFLNDVTNDRIKFVGPSDWNPAYLIRKLIKQIQSSEIDPWILITLAIVGALVLIVSIVFMFRDSESSGESAEKKNN